MYLPTVFLIPNEFKVLPSCVSFQVKIKTWVSQSCLCRLCKHIHQKGFILPSNMIILEFLIKLSI